VNATLQAQHGQDYDLVIVGGGLVGASLAIALAGRGLRMALVEAAQPSVESQPNYDDRALALAYGTRRIFEGLGVWQDIAPLAGPIDKIHVSERGQFGFTHLDCAEEGVPALGYVITARELGRVLLAHLPALADLDVIAPARVTNVTVDTQAAHLTVEQADGPRHIHPRLLVAADGVQSFIRDALQFPVRRWQYGQSAVVANITPQRPHRHVAYERFTDSGPVALLPMHDERCALVWTVADTQLEDVLALDDAAFTARFQARFGQRLGCFTRVGARQAYPLAMVRATESVRPRVAVIGNAAHTLHPIAGQGFNLGLRDVAALADVLTGAVQSGADIGALEVLSEYQQWRGRDQQLVSLATDGLARLFSNPLAPLRIGRNLGMLAMDLLPGARHRLARAAMGLTGKLPRLARGLPLG
jgi:2-octaprenyl-6-methoxyphenol hydroxylase